MLEKFTHTNSNNETLDFTELCIYANYNDLRDFEWTVSQSNDKITGFYKGVVKKTIPFVFLVDAEKANEIKNKFYEHFEIDILTKRTGYLELNGYKYYCYVTKSVKSLYLASKGYLKLDVELVSDNSLWYKETLRTIDFSESEIEGSLTYPFTYPFTYGGDNTSTIVNEDFTESDAIIRVYGACENPVVRLNDIVYRVNASLEEGEYLEIKTKDKTLYKFDNKGVQTNIFHLRDKENSPFQKIPSGTLTVNANGKFKVDIVIIEARGEPKWV